MGTTVDEVIAAHRAVARSFEAAGLASFVRAEGEGEPIVLLHGLPSSSFLYRKVIGELAARGFAAMSFDLPGLGLSRRRLASPLWNEPLGPRAGSTRWS
jgi:alpha-beta hydrolase superfamily lysophospholipase